MKKIRLILILSFFTVNSFTQEKNSLKELLWESVEPCYKAMTQEIDDEIIKNTNIFDGVDNIDDTKNGYLKISGSYPTCGCFCLNIAGAYKQNDNNYTILINENWSCTSTFKLRSNKELDSIFPENFGILDFIPNFSSLNPENTNAYFYLDIEIPRKGTDTKVSLELIPFGIDVPSNKLITYEFSENNSTRKYIRGINEIIDKITNNNTIDYLLKKEFDKISIKDINIIKNEIDINNNQFKFKDIQEISDHLITLKNKYDLFNLIQFNSIILGWNKNENRFYIKEKSKNIEYLSFKDFILQKAFWNGPSC